MTVKGRKGTERRGQNERGRNRRQLIMDMERIVSEEEKGETGDGGKRGRTKGRENKP